MLGIVFHIIFRGDRHPSTVDCIICIRDEVGRALIVVVCCYNIIGVATTIDEAGVSWMC